MPRTARPKPPKRHDPLESFLGEADRASYVGVFSIQYFKQSMRDAGNGCIGWEGKWGVDETEPDYDEEGAEVAHDEIPIARYRNKWIAAWKIAYRVAHGVMPRRWEEPIWACGMPHCVNGHHIQLSHRDVLSERFWNLITPEDADGHRFWRGDTIESKDGGKVYPVFYARGHTVSVRRLVYEAEIAEVPSGDVVVMACGQDTCVAKAHMVVKSRGALGIEALMKSARERRDARTHCPNGHPYTPENTYTTKKGARQCRTCTKARNDRYKADSLFVGAEPRNPEASADSLEVAFAKVFGEGVGDRVPVLTRASAPGMSDLLSLLSPASVEARPQAGDDGDDEDAWILGLRLNSGEGS